MNTDNILIFMDINFQLILFVNITKCLFLKLPRSIDVEYTAHCPGTNHILKFIPNEL